MTFVHRVRIFLFSKGGVAAGAAGVAHSPNLQTRAVREVFILKIVAFHPVAHKGKVFKAGHFVNGLAAGCGRQLRYPGLQGYALGAAKHL